MPHKDPETKRKYGERYRDAHRDEKRAYDRRHRLWRLYRLTEAQWDTMLIGQSGRCALCGGPLDGKVDLDHNHETGAVRSLLHHRCNIGLPYVEDLTFRNRAMVYLEEYDG